MVKQKNSQVFKPESQIRGLHFKTFIFSANSRLLQVLIP